MKKMFLAVLSIALCLIFVAACGADNQQKADNVLVDVLGNELVIDQPYERIVSISPAATEILYAIEADEYLLANTIYCDYPAEANNKPKIGDFSDPNIELIMSYEPQLVLTASLEQEDIVNRLQELGINVFCLDAYNVQDVLKNIEMVGIITGQEAEARQLLAEMNTVMADIKTKVAAQTEKPDVFVEIWNDPLMTVGGNSFINDMVEMAGGHNIAADLEMEYPQFSKEQLLSIDPDVYLLVGHDRSVDEVTKIEGFSALSAVKNQRVYIIEDDFLTICGPRIIDGMEALFNAFYPQK